MFLVEHEDVMHCTIWYTSDKRYMVFKSDENENGDGDWEDMDYK